MWGNLEIAARTAANTMLRYPDKISDGLVILSFRVCRGCDLWRSVVDSVADGTLAG
jgi:hypothetical protein